MKGGSQPCSGTVKPFGVKIFRYMDRIPGNKVSFCKGKGDDKPVPAFKLCVSLVGHRKGNDRTAGFPRQNQGTVLDDEWWSLGTVRRQGNMVPGVSGKTEKLLKGSDSSSVGGSPDGPNPPSPQNARGQLSIFGQGNQCRESKGPSEIKKGHRQELVVPEGNDHPLFVCILSPVALRIDIGFPERCHVKAN